MHFFDLHTLSKKSVQLIYLIVTVALGKAAIPIISLAMIAAVYGLQVCILLKEIVAHPLICLNLVTGTYLYIEERVHAGRMDGHLPPRVRYLLFAADLL